MTVVDGFQIFGSLATAGAAFAAFWTIREVKKQRESTYQPNVIIEGSNFHVNLENYPFKFLRNDYSAIDDTSSIHLRYNNIGFASASDVKFKFDINYHRYLKKIRKASERLKLPVEFKEEDNILFIRSEKYEFENEFRNINDSKHDERFFFTELARYNKYKHCILPIHIDNSPNKLEFPDDLKFVISMYFLLHNLDEELSLSSINFYLDLSFKDIGNKVHNERFEVVIMFFSLDGTPRLHIAVNKQS